MLTLIATLKAKPGKEQMLLDECAKITQLVRANEQGCLMYIPHVAVEDSGEVTFVERYVDQDALDKHTSTPYFQAFAAQFDELLAAPLELKLLKECK